LDHRTNNKLKTSQNNQIKEINHMMGRELKDKERAAEMAPDEISE
jgi:hypothetical protein